MCVRYLVEGATGVYTGSVFHDQRIQREGHHGEFRCLLGEDHMESNFALKCTYLRAPQDGSTILQKSHHNSLVLELCVCDTVILALHRSFHD